MLRRLFDPVWRNWKVYFFAVFIGSTWFIFDIYVVTVLQKAIALIDSGNLVDLKELVIQFALVYGVVYARKWSVRNKSWVRFRDAFSKDLFPSALRQYRLLENNTIERLGTWRVYEIFNSGVQKRTDVLLELTVAIPEVIIKVSFTLFLVFQLWLWYGIGFMSVMLIGVLVIFYCNSRGGVWRYRRKTTSIKHARYIVRGIMNKFEILQSWKVEWETQRLADVYTEHTLYNTWWNNWQRRMFNIGLIITQGSVVMVLMTSYWSLQSGTFDIVLFTGLVAMIGYLVQLMLKLADQIKKISESMTHVERIRDLFDTTPVMSGYEEWKQFVYKNGSVELKSLTYWYTTDIPIFKGFSLKLVWWKKTALVGISWSGKSTLVKLISGYLKPDSGQVIIDGQDLEDVALKSYYSHIWYLTQEPSVFDGTVRENLTYAMGDGIDLIEDSLSQAIKLSNCDFIYELPNWLDTEIWERGVRLSGGQRQRLAIAKIFLKDPKIIILDEPTSALDSFSEEAITEAMHSLFKDRTVIIIAHRLQTVKEADDIILLGTSKSEIWNQKKNSGSQVLERGTHQELVAQWGQYARMLEVQTGF